MELLYVRRSELQAITLNTHRHTHIYEFTYILAKMG